MAAGTLTVRGNVGTHLGSGMRGGAIEVFGDADDWAGAELRGGRVLEHDKDDEALAARMFRKYGDAPFYIAHIADTSSVYEFPSPEVAG